MESYPTLTARYLKKMAIKDEDVCQIFNDFQLPFPDIFKPILQNGIPTWILIPATHPLHVESLVGKHLDLLKGCRIFWVAYPKKSSKIESDLGRDESWKTLQAFGFTPNFAVAIDEKWSGLRFKYDPDGNSWVHEFEMKRQDPAGRPEIIPPVELESAWLPYPEAKLFYEGLSYTCRKEYSGYVAEAKKEETRINRASKVIEALLLKKKTRL
jgi:hypothetical protein